MVKASPSQSHSAAASVRDKEASSAVREVRDQVDEEKRTLSTLAHPRSDSRNLIKNLDSIAELRRAFRPFDELKKHSAAMQALQNARLPDLADSASQALYRFCDPFRLDHDALRALELGHAALDRFRTTSDVKICVRHPTVRNGSFFTSDLVSRIPKSVLAPIKQRRRRIRKRRDRVETVSQIENGSPTEIFTHDESYKHVTFNGRSYTFGQLAANVIEILHEAAQNGSGWRSGKSVLSEAGSKQLKMHDLFKGVSEWTELIESDGRGQYRLRIGITGNR